MGYERELHNEIGSSDADMSGTGDIMTFTPATAVEIVEFGYILTTATVDAAGGLVVKADVRPTAGSDTDRGDGDAGVLTLTSAQANAAAGKVLKCRPASPTVVKPGEQVILELTTAPDSGVGLPFIVYRAAPTAVDTDVETVVVE